LEIAYLVHAKQQHWYVSFCIIHEKEQSEHFFSTPSRYTFPPLSLVLPKKVAVRPMTHTYCSASTAASRDLLTKGFTSTLAPATSTLDWDQNHLLLYLPITFFENVGGYIELF
jgi:hypothetical protein